MIYFTGDGGKGLGQKRGMKVYWLIIATGWMDRWMGQTEGGEVQVVNPKKKESKCDDDVYAHRKANGDVLASARPSLLMMMHWCGHYHL